jgi:hypothetical protein
MDMLYPFVCHHLLADGRLSLGVDHNREGPLCCVGNPGGQDIARFGQRRDSLSALLQGAEAKLKQWYEAKGQDEASLIRTKHFDGALSFKLRFAVDFIRDQGKVEFGDQRGLCCTLRTINGHTVWHGGSKLMGLNTLLWEVEKQLTQHYNRVGWQCRSPEEEMMTSLKSNLKPPPLLLNVPKLPLTPQLKAQDAEDKEMQELFKQLQHLQQMQQIQQQQYMQQQQHMYQLFFEQMQRQQQQQQQLFQHVLQVLILQQNLQPSEAKIAADKAAEAAVPLSPPSESTPTTPKSTKPRKKAKK